VQLSAARQMALVTGRLIEGDQVRNPLPLFLLRSHPKVSIIAGLVLKAEIDQLKLTPRQPRRGLGSPLA